RTETADVERFLQRDREPAQRVVTAQVGVARRLSRALEVAHHDRVELRVVPFDAPDVELGELGGRDLARAEIGQELGGARERIHGYHPRDTVMRKKSTLNPMAVRPSEPWYPVSFECICPAFSLA